MGVRGYVRPDSTQNHVEADGSVHKARADQCKNLVRCFLRRDEHGIDDHIR